MDRDTRRERLRALAFRSCSAQTCSRSPNPTRSARVNLVVAYAGDPAVVTVARAVAREHSAGWGEEGKPVDLMLPVLHYLGTIHSFDDSLRQINEGELTRIAKALVALGLLTTKGRGRTLRYVLPRVELPSSQDVADVVLAEMRAGRRMEVFFSELVSNSPGLVLLGLEGPRAEEALYRACRDGKLTESYLLGMPRVLNLSA